MKKKATPVAASKSPGLTRGQVLLILVISIAIFATFAVLAPRAVEADEATTDAVETAPATDVVKEVVEINTAPTTDIVEVVSPVITEAPEPLVASATDSDSFWDGVTGFFKDSTVAAQETTSKAIKDMKVKMDLQVSDEQARKMEEELEEASEDIGEDLMTDAVYDHTQIDCLIRALVFEAGGETRLGKLWVLGVIENRTKLQYRGKVTQCAVIFDRKQFSFANINPGRVPKYSADLIESVQLAAEFYKSDRRDITDCATHYVRTDHVSNTKWAEQAMEGTSPEGLRLKAIIGNHSFFGPSSCEVKVAAKEEEVTSE